MWEVIREYLTFTRKERFGVLGMIIGIFVLLIVPNFFKRRQGSPDPDAFKKYQPAAQAFAAGGSNRPDTAAAFAAGPKPALAAFFFDPNQLPAEGWARLGIRDRTIQTIQHFLARGGLFRQAEDLQKIYGLSAPDYHRLLPLVRLKKMPEPVLSYPQAKWTKFGSKENGSAQRTFSKTWQPSGRPVEGPETAYKPAYRHKTASDININQADSGQLTGFPGIGPALASRILRFRDKLGGFVDVAQVGETFGLPDSVFQSIRPYLHVGDDSIHRIDLNEAAESQLQQHPYIRWALAKAILRYREQHGRFHSVEELQQLVQIDAQKFKQLAPYVVVR